jgi:uncharacterized repeat protein (TIGR01451 family)
MKRTPQRLCLIVLAGSLLLQAGCFGVTHNPSYFPYLLPFGDVIPTHAKPPGGGYFANFDPHAVKLEVRPMEDRANPVRSQHVLIATVRDDTGQPRRKRRVEWIVEGVGNIVEVDESGLFPGRGYKDGTKYAVSYTGYSESRVTRGNLNAADDFVIRPGQTYCVISSAVEGDTHVTVYAPGIANWEKNKIYVTIRWVDANWTLPAPGQARAGAVHVLTTKIFRQTDGKPLAGYRVRYTVKDGPDAVFAENRTREYVAVSDLSGLAHAGLTEMTPLPGRNRIGVEIIRPPDPTAPSGSGVVIAAGETTVDWLAPAVVLNVTGPTAASINQEVTYTTTVHNTGQVETQFSTVTSTVPDGLQFVRSVPPGLQEGRQLTWALGKLESGQSSSIQAVFKTLQNGSITYCAALQTAEGFKDQKCVTTLVSTPGLKVNISGPTTGLVGTPLTINVSVATTGSAPLSKIAVIAKLDPALEHAKGNQVLSINIPSMNPGEVRAVDPLVVTPRQAGRLSILVTATAEGGVSDTLEHAIQVGQSQIGLNMEGPRVRMTGRPAEFTLRVTNPTNSIVNNVLVRDRLPAELTFVSAGQGGQLQGGEVVWNLGPLQPREERVLQIHVSCDKEAKAAVQKALATAEGGARAEAQAAIEIRPSPAGDQLLVRDTVDVVEIGGRTTYEIKVVNSSTQPLNSVEIKATVPNEMKILQPRGPVPGTVAGQVVSFGKVTVEPGQSAVYTIEVEALRAGDVRFRVEMLRQGLQQPRLEEESTRIVEPEPANRLPKG